jgi:hypothetical protein
VPRLLHVFGQLMVSFIHRLQQEYRLPATALALLISVQERWPHFLHSRLDFSGATTATFVLDTFSRKGDPVPGRSVLRILMRSGDLKAIALCVKASRCIHFLTHFDTTLSHAHLKDRFDVEYFKATNFDKLCYTCCVCSYQSLMFS